MILGNTKERILQYIEYKGISKPQFYTDLGIKRGLLDSDKMGSTVADTIIAKILVRYTDISPMWLLTGEGSMFRDNKTQEENKPIASQISPAEESIIYKIYKEKDEENKILIEEIGGLKERIRQLESQHKEPEHQSKESEVLEAFTNKSSGDYGESSLPTKQSTISKRLSAGKI